MTSVTSGLFDIQFNFADTVTLTSVDTRGTFQNFVHRLRLTADIARNVELSTRGQGINPNWKEAHWHIITASHMANVVRRQKEELDGLVKTITYPAPIQGSTWVQII